jgi:hypothetical protein
MAQGIKFIFVYCKLHVEQHGVRSFTSGDVSCLFNNLVLSLIGDGLGDRESSLLRTCNGLFLRGLTFLIIMGILHCRSDIIGQSSVTCNVYFVWINVPVTFGSMNGGNWIGIGRLSLVLGCTPTKTSE